MKILLTEADGALAGRLFHLLVKNGYQTTAVKTGQAALDEIGRSYFDMVIAEACTPAVDGCARPAARRPCGAGRGRCRNLSFLSSTTLDPKRASAAVYSDCRACHARAGHGTMKSSIIPEGRAPVCRGRNGP